MSTKTKVLIAEDSLVLGDVMRFNLLRAGFDVSLARNGDQAFEALTNKTFDILVTDFEMPGMNGEELCRRTRADLGIHDLKIVMCSAKGMELDREELKSRLRITEILFKPFSTRDLINLLQTLAVSTDSNPSHLALTT
jgi:CheY-like chemotaxis protein